MPRKNMDGSRGCFTPAVACIVLFLLLCLGRAWSEERPLPDKVSLDFVDASLQDVARSVSLAYGVPVLVDAGAEARVTFHLDGVGLLEGLTSLCSTLGLELIRDGTVFHIRKRLEHGENFFRVTDSLVSLDVRERDVREFIWDFAANTGLNVVASPDVAGPVSGRLESVPPAKALRVLLESHGYRVRRDAECFRVMAELMGIGLPLARLNRILFRVKPREQMKLLGRALESMRFEGNGKIAVMKLTRKDFDDCGALSEHADTVVNYGLDTVGTEMALLAREGEDGKIKFSLRAKEPQRIDDVAQKFGGGGHPQASGITMEGKLDDVVELVLHEMIKKVMQ